MTNTKTKPLTEAEKKNTKDQAEMFASADLETLKEIGQLMGLREEQIPEDATRESMIELLTALKRGDITIAKTVTVDGKELVCPPGHMVIRVTPKSIGMEFGPKSKEAFFFAINGEACVGRRGVAVVIPDKYRSCWQDAIKYEYEMDETPDARQAAKPPIKREVPTEDVNIIQWNRNLEAEAKIERELIENAKIFQAEKKAEKLAKQAFYQNLTR